MRTSAVPEPVSRKTHPRRKDQGISRSWCCAFGVATLSPDNRGAGAVVSHLAPSKPQKPAYSGSFLSSPSPSSRIGLGLIDPRRILSPGRVSPMNSEATLDSMPESAVSVPAAAAGADSEVEAVDPPAKTRSRMAAQQPRPSPSPAEKAVRGMRTGCLDLRLVLKGKNGSYLVLDLDSYVLCENSSYFSAMVLEARRKAPDDPGELPKVEVPEIEHLPGFKDTVELMYEKDSVGWLMKAGVLRSIDILEVSSSIAFAGGVDSCLRYLEAVPWNENEEEKLKALFSRRSFEGPLALDILSRLYGGGAARGDGGESLSLRLLRSISGATCKSSRKILQTLVNGLLSESSIYHKDPAGLTTEGLYEICRSSLTSLVDFFHPSATLTLDALTGHVDNLTWLVELLLERHVAEEFVAIWADQDELLRLRALTSPMVRFELSRVTACVWEALGRGRLQCPVRVRWRVQRVWFGPMLEDFGWLQRCPRGLDLRGLEESMGRAILTLPLDQQQDLLVDWFACFSAAADCPNLSQAFQVWWRRSFLRSHPPVDQVNHALCN